jgi:hypothetical protein
VLADGMGLADEPPREGLEAEELLFALDADREGVELSCSRVDRRGVTSAIVRVITSENS